MFRSAKFLHWIVKRRRLSWTFRKRFKPVPYWALAPALSVALLSTSDDDKSKSYSRKAEQLANKGSWSEAVQIYNQILVQAVSSHGTNSWNLIEPTRDLCWAIHRHYETNSSDSDDLKMSTILLRQATDIASNADIDEDLRQTEMAAICEQLSAVWLELDKPENAIEWIKRGITHISRARCKQDHVPRFLVFLSTCLNRICRYEEAESTARLVLKMSRKDSESMCIAYYELGTSICFNKARLEEAADAFRNAIRIAKRRGASMKPILLESESQLAELLAAAK